MRRAGRLAAEILDALAPHVVPGVSTAGARRHRLPDDARRRRRARRRSAIAATRRAAASRSTMSSATASRATSALKDGDIVNIDVTPIVDGWHGDTSRMYLVGDVPHQGAQAGRRHLRMPDARHRAGEARQPSRRHRQRHPAPRRSAALQRRPRFLRPWRRPAVPRQPRSGPRRPPRHRPRAQARACSSPSSR